MWDRRRNALAAALFVAAGVLAACSGGGSPGAATARPTATAPASVFPAQDTPFDQLPPALRRLWSVEALSLVPGAAVVRGTPAAPAVRNMTAGHVSEAMAAEWARALMLRHRLVQWALANRQWDFLATLDEFTVDGANLWRPAIDADAPVTQPDCAAYPVGLSLWWTDDAQDPVVATTHVHWYFAEQYAGPCATTVATPSGTVTLQHWTSSAVRLVPGVDKADDVFGHVWRGPVALCDGLAGHDAACGR